MLEIKFGYVQLAENKMMAVQWLVVMDVTRGIIGEFNKFFFSMTKKKNWSCLNKLQGLCGNSVSTRLCCMVLSYLFVEKS